MFQLDSRGGFVLGYNQQSGLALSPWSKRTIFWPPGPLPLRNASVRSLSGTKAGRSGIFFFHDEDVAINPLLNIGGLFARSRNCLNLKPGVKPRNIAHCSSFMQFWKLKQSKQLDIKGLETGLWLRNRGGASEPLPPNNVGNIGQFTTSTHHFAHQAATSIGQLHSQGPTIRN